MLGKLLKHEFRATGRIMLPLIGAELLLSVLAGLSVRGLDRIQNMNFLGVTYVMTLIVFFLGLFAVGVVALVLMIQRFYRNLLRDEGYLSMTLPVSVDEHIWSKLIVSFVWFAAVGLLSVLAMLVMMAVGSRISFVGDLNFRELFDRLRELVRLIGAGIYHLTGENGRQIRIEDLLPDAAGRDQRRIDTALEGLRQRYGLDFAGNLDRIFHGETLYRTMEYMRRHRQPSPQRG